MREFRTSTDNANSSQLCWNPVINSILAVCTETGGLNLYALKEQAVDFHTIDQSLKAKSCCWSPKGKQIVAGFANGKLIQFNMEMKPARIIECPQGIIGGSFDTIAIQWLSTYQFAVALLSHQEESRPGKFLFSILINSNRFFYLFNLLIENYQEFTSSSLKNVSYKFVRQF